MHSVVLKNDATGEVVANVEIRRTVNGETTIEEKSFRGTEEEVRSQLKDVDGIKIKVKDKE